MARSIQNIIDTLTNQIQTAFNNTVKTDTSSPIGQLIGIFAASDFELYQLGDAIKSSIDLSTATSEELDVLSKLFLSRRKQASAARLDKLDIEGTANQVINGLRIQIIGTQLTYTAASSITLDGTGKSSADFVAEQTGVQQVNTNLGGVTFSVLNNNNVVTSVIVDGTNSKYEEGTNLESDNELRFRLTYSSSKNGTNLVDTLAGSLIASAYISKAQVYEYKMSYIFEPTEELLDPTQAPAWTGSSTEKGVLGFFEPIVVLTNVAEEEITTQKNAVAQLIWNNKPPGIISTQGYTDDPNKGTGITQGTAKDQYGLEHVINFVMAKKVEIDINIALEAAPSGTNNTNQVTTQNITSALDSYISRVLIAGKAIYSQAFCDIANAASGFYIKSFTWGLSESDQVILDINLRDHQGARSYFVPGKITVTY